MLTIVNKLYLSHTGVDLLTKYTPLLSNSSGSKKTKDNDREGQTAVLTRTKLKRPPMYKVIFLNDDYTTQEFVVLVLRRFFQKNSEEAIELMKAVHNTGKGIAGIYPYDIAVTKVKQVQLFAQQHEMPLRLTIEAE